jgi:hypothetical protein
VQRQLQQREKEDQTAAEIWCERLEDTYAAARRGLMRTEADPERWAAGVGYLGALNKSIELGLKSSGQIEGGRGATSVGVEFLIILPTAAPAPTTEGRVIDTTAAVEPAGE